MKNKEKSILKYIPAASVVFFALGIITSCIYVAAINSPAFADTWSDNVSSVFRSFMAHLTSFIPFSLAEFLVISSPVILYALISGFLRLSSRGKEYAVRCIVLLLSFLVLLYSVFVVNFGISYYTSTLDERLGLERQKISAEELYDTLTEVIDELNSLAPDVMFVSGKGSVRPYSHDECVIKCEKSFEKLAEEYSFIKTLDAPVKQIVLSDYMTYTHISGMYTFFTGEANLNTNYPYYVNVYTTAHEMAHQRGIARENEANFIAYLVCITSDDAYMRYSGYLNMYEYLVSPLYSASPSLYKDAVAKLDGRVKYDLLMYSEFFDKYRENKAADVSDAVNNTYLVMQGTKEGTKSYGMVVDLAVAYHKVQNGAKG